MLLAIDVGNSNIVGGVFDGDRLVADFRLHTEALATGDELGLVVAGLLGLRNIERGTVDAVVVSNVVPTLSRSIDELCHQYFAVAPMHVGPGMRTGMRIVVEDPRQVGADRIVNAIAAFNAYGGPAVIVDLGTATTFDAISDRGDYLGGAIAPGMIISLNALVARAAKLNRVDLVVPPSVIGRTTNLGVQSGGGGTVSGETRGSDAFGVGPLRSARSARLRDGLLRDGPSPAFATDGAAEHPRKPGQTVVTAGRVVLVASGRTVRDRAIP